MRPLLFAALLAPTAFAGPVTVTFLHGNDFHAHLEPTLIRKKPYGGYARLATVIRETRAKEKNVVLLSAGDTFQGTLYFNVYEGLADLAFMNAVGFQAMTLGNHEFDRGPKPLATFAALARFPLLSTNTDVTGDPDLRGKIAPSTVIRVGREKIGVVGCTTPDTPNISSPGDTVRFLELVATVQRAVDNLGAKGIDKIVLLSHIGFEEDQALVGKLRNVDLVIGGHSHTPLGTPKIDGWPEAKGAYPTLVPDLGGVSVPVVQAWEWGKTLGKIRVRFDGRGRVAKIEEARPIVIDEKIPEDPEIAGLIAAFRKPIEAKANEVVATAAERLPKDLVAGELDNVMSRIVADAMLAATAKQGAVAAFINAGGVRSGLEAGPITYGGAVSVQPFANTLTVLDVTGAELRAALRRGAGGRLLPSAGSSYRVVGEDVADVVLAGAPLDDSRTYRIALLGFTANGGDSHFELKAAPGRRVDTGIVDIDALIEYLRANAPVRVSATRVRN